LSLKRSVPLIRPVSHAVALIALLLLSPGCEGTSPSATSSPAPVPAAPSPPVPETSLETAALTTFYHATNGPDWTDNTAWLTDAPVEEWHGVATNENGRVVGLALTGNGLSGEIPPDLADLASLESLALNRNQLSGEIPAELGNLASLTDLRLAGNQLSGKIPAELGNMASLTDLRLQGNQLSGEIPPELGNMASLTDLRLQGNQLSGEIPPELGNLASLTSLSLTLNELSGEIPPELGNLANLTYLGLDRNQLSGEIPPELGNLASLTLLGLARNRLSGPIPPELGNLASLTYLGLERNQLSGPIPAELGQLASLTYLGLERNLLDGAIPAELGRLSNLERLELAWNQLVGEIPPELGNLANLTELRLRANQLGGEIPPELDALVNLKSLSLDWNRLSGEIPPGLVALPSLTDLRITGNRLSGEIPPELQRPAPTRVAPGIAASPSPERRPAISFEAVFGGRNFDRPVELGAYPVGPPGDGEPGLFLAELEGLLLLLHPDSDEAVELLDIRDRVAKVAGDEGLLSAALDPHFDENGYLWLYYTVGGNNALEGAPRKTRLSRFIADLDNLRRVDPESELIVLEVGQEAGSHYGGAIRFGSDGMLYLGFGDSNATDESQRLETLLGSIIRIDVRAASEASPYAVPSDNPFVGVPIARPEIWAYGFRNPWRMAFDPVTGVLWAGDVGRADIEEINHVEAGGNYGWDLFEGTRCVNPAAGCDPYGFTTPTATYSHKIGCAVVGGMVYRGKAIPALVGHYLFSDHCGGQLWAVPPDGGELVEISVIPAPVSSFGTDSNGEVYILSFGGPALRIASL
jgi:glucose/arabinose dehydrogenase